MSWDAARVRQALRAVTDQTSGRNVLDLGCIREVKFESGAVRVALARGALRGEDEEAIRAAVVAAALKVPGVVSAHASFDDGAASASASRPALEPSKKSAAPPQGRGQFAPIRPAGIKHVIAIASGKGGVGKSTVAVNLARAMARLGKRVGLLDADVYGPSTPTMLGLPAALAEVGPTEKIAPLFAHGIKAMSMGFIVPASKAMAWRGPMVMNALVQLFVSVEWGELDVLLLDLPPGTGDVHLTLAQQVALDGAIVVSTPQEVALADVRRGVEMFRRTNIPVLGIVENMAYFRDAERGLDVDLFGRGGARTAAAELEAPFLGEVPFFTEVRIASDAGLPLAGLAADVFTDLAKSVLAMLER